ncbi:MAG: hypothetical protein HY277_08650, partial [Ignavibacteriales bacterium]|nr:hypothetical protein [Ignavibacteriales bacterium]
MNKPAIEKEKVFDTFRRWGYLQARIDPFGTIKPCAVPELELDSTDAQQGRKYYCGSVGVEFMHIHDGERRRWIQKRM